MSARGNGPTAVIGLALGSGGARGWCHIGVLRGLAEQGVAPDVVAGCSMGALVGAAWAADRLDPLEEWARDLTQARFLRHMDLRLDQGGLIGGAAVASVLKDLGLPERIEDLNKPFLAVATDMSTGREVWLREGPLLPAIRASISIPGVFSPQNLGGRWLLDGGLINPVPVSACRALGAHCTLAVNPNAKSGRALWEPAEEAPFWERMVGHDLREQLPEGLQKWLPEPEAKEPCPGYLDVMGASIDILTEFLRASRSAADPADVMLDADLNHISVMELFRADEAIAEGKRLVDAAKNDIQHIVGRTGGTG